ncbi:MAG TPA: HNH endonuclease [Oxalobacteraceae bacterium]|nr:HNH endonuclease [Oxalobacteraceae bacterium]
MLREQYANTKTAELAGALGKSTTTVYQKAAGLGLTKSPEYLASPAACRLRRGDNVGAAFRFKPGQVVWNKGTNFTAGGRSPETRFQPGQMPHNTSPVGSYRLDKDGTLQRKIGNDKGNNSKRWRGVHELAWVEVNGPLPPKHIVVFKQGMRSNKLEEITIDRVECISLAENMRRNTRHNLPKELSDLIQLRGALSRAINHRIKNEQ